jgi:type IV secretory pathway TrbF-like protein
VLSSHRDDSTTATTPWRKTARWSKRCGAAGDRARLWRLASIVGLSK